MKKISGPFFVRKDVLGVQCPVSRSACVTHGTRRAHTCVPGRACHCMHLKENLTCVPRAAQTLACMACKATCSRFVNEMTARLARARARRLCAWLAVCAHTPRAHAHVCVCVRMCACAATRYIVSAVCALTMHHVAAATACTCTHANDALCGRRVWINACKFVLARARARDMHMCACTHALRAQHACALHMSMCSMAAQQHAA